MRVITPLLVHQTAIEVHQAFRRIPLVRAKLESENRNGCWFVFTDPNGDIILETLLGEKPAIKGKLENYQRFAAEKLQRTYRMHAERGDVLSRQSANEAAEEYPGAALGSVEYLYGAGASGYPGHGDELLSAGVLTRLGCVLVQDVRLLFLSHPNKFYDEAVPEVRSFLRSPTD